MPDSMQKMESLQTKRVLALTGKMRAKQTGD